MKRTILVLSLLLLIISAGLSGCTNRESLGSAKVEDFGNTTDDPPKVQNVMEQPAYQITTATQAPVKNNSSSGFITASLSPVSAAWCDPVTFLVTDTTGKKQVHIMIASQNNPNNFSPLVDVDTTTAGSGSVKYVWDTSTALPTGLTKQPGVYFVRVVQADMSDYVNLQIQMTGDKVVNGLCTGSLPSCLASQGLCNNACKNLTSDSQNCGTCGIICQNGQTCQNGVCSSVVPSCIQGQTNCAGQGCRNLLTDTTNCGLCGTSCTSGQVCQNGMCIVVCAQGQMSCILSPGTLAQCIDVTSNVANCGNCNVKCSSGQSCINGQCASVSLQKIAPIVVATTQAPVLRKLVVATCSSGTTMCGGTCVNTNSDRYNCGSCGTVCPAGETCQVGKCGFWIK